MAHKPIIIVGGGPAGTMCALALNARGHSVVLATNTPRRVSCGETCSSLAAALLEGACRRPIPPTLRSPVNTFASAWGTSALQVRQLDTEPTGSHYLITRPALDEWLLASSSAAGITVLPDYTVEKKDPHGSKWQLKCRTTGHRSSIAASFVVEATGRAGRAVTRPEVHRHYLDALMCATVELHPDEPLPTTLTGALVESSAQGWWYMVRQPKGGLTLCCFTDADLLPSAPAQRDWFITQLRLTSHLACLADYLPEYMDIRVCEARTTVRQTLWQDNWLCIGDAAWSIDPLSGSGIERAVQAGLRAATALAASVESQGQTTNYLRQFAYSQGQAFQLMLTSRRWYYQQERRWPDALFWRRRQ